jgi:hypothetical protein
MVNAVSAFTRNQPRRNGDLFTPAAQHNAPVNGPVLAAALLLGSPDFQRR